LFFTAGSNEQVFFPNLEKMAQIRAVVFEKNFIKAA